MTLNLIETLKASIYRPKHIKTITYLIKFTENPENQASIFFKKSSSNKSAFMLNCMALFVLLRATPLTSLKKRGVGAACGQADYLTNLRFADDILLSPTKYAQLKL